MTDATTPRRLRSLAYACFLLVGATALLGSLGSLLPESVVEPAYLGFFVLIPLTLASAIALIAGAVLALKVGRGDPILITLLAVTIVVITIVVVAYSDVMPVRLDGPVIDVLISVYGLATLSVCIHWFAVRRHRLGSPPGLGSAPER
jgi:hypothetical protein